MNPPRPPVEPFDPSGSFDSGRAQAASELLMRLNDSPTDDRVLDAWLDWCDEHPENRQTFERMLTIWQTAGRVPLDRRLRRELAVNPARRWQWGVGLAAGLATVAAVAVALMVGRFEPEVQTLSTATAMHSSAVLADGSHVDLGAQTRLTAVLSRRQRQVHVETGEAFFEVVPDGERPFVVEAGPLRITAVGTAFNVRRVELRVIVTVAEGEVDIAPTGTGAVLGDDTIRAGAGRQAVLDETLDRLTLTDVDPQAAASWRSGVLRFQDEPLAYVVADINRYAKRPLEIADPSVGRMSYTGAVFTDRIDDWLQALPSAFPLNVTAATEPDAAVLLTAQ